MDEWIKREVEKYLNRQHGVMARSSVFRKLYAWSMTASVEKPTQEEKCNTQGVAECKNIFTRNTLGLYYKLEIISTYDWTFQNFSFMHTLIYFLHCWTKSYLVQKSILSLRGLLTSNENIPIKTLILQCVPQLYKLLGALEKA